LNRCHTVAPAPDESHPIRVPSHILHQRAIGLVRIPVLVDQEIGDAEAIDASGDRVRVTRVGRDCLAARLPEHFAGVAGHHEPGTGGLAGQPLAGDVKIGMGQALR